MEEVSASNADDQQIPPSVTAKGVLHLHYPKVHADHIYHAKNYSRQGYKQVLQQGHNQVHARVPNRALIDKYENKHIYKYNIR